jgi:hypothetical protein
VRAVGAYRLLPQVVVPPIAFGLPVVDIALGLALLVGAAVRFAAVLSAVMLVVFLVALTSAGARGLQIDCGCFGGRDAGAAHGAPTLEIVRDLALLAVAGFWRCGRTPPWPWPTAQEPAEDRAAGALHPAARSPDTAAPPQPAEDASCAAALTAATRPEGVRSLTVVPSTSTVGVAVIPSLPA